MIWPLLFRVDVARPWQRTSIYLLTVIAWCRQINTQSSRTSPTWTLIIQSNDHVSHKVSGSNRGPPSAAVDLNRDKWEIMNAALLWLAPHKCAHRSRRHSCDGVESPRSSSASICASSSALLPVCPRPRSTSISFNLLPSSLPAVWWKMTECEAMMEYFPSSLWISRSSAAHTRAEEGRQADERAERLMHHAKVSRVAPTPTPLISVGCQRGACHMLHRSTAWDISHAVG